MDIAELLHWRIVKLNNSKDIAFAHDQVVLTFERYFGTCVFTIKDGISAFYSHWFVLFTRTSSDYDAALWFFLSSVGDNDTTGSFFFSSSRTVATCALPPRAAFSSAARRMIGSKSASPSAA